MPRNNQILKIDPPEALIFTGPFTEVVKSALTLTNPSDGKIAFKIKTTAPKRYCVRPNSGSLCKDESMTVSVMLQPFEYDPYEKTKHKFMIQSLMVSGDVDEKDLWLEADKDRLMDTKLRVVFENEKPESVPEVPREEEIPINNLDNASDPVVMTPHKANFSVPTNVTSSGDDNYGRVTDENSRLRKEVETIREELQRLKRVAMSDTKSASSAVTTSQASANPTPTGVGLLFHDTTNILILIAIMVAAFAVGIFASGRVLGA